VFTVVDAAEATAARESLGVGAGDEQSERLSPDGCGQDELLGRSDPLPGDPIGQTENTWGEPVGGFSQKGRPMWFPHDWDASRLRLRASQSILHSAIREAGHRDEHLDAGPS